MQDALQDSPIFKRIRQDIEEHPVLVYMKGTPMFPQCGFSAAVVQALSLLGVKFKAIDVLTDPPLRDAIKQFSNWPTIPQLFVRGEFVGGADIVREMYESGELATFLKDRKIDLAD